MKICKRCILSEAFSGERVLHTGNLFKMDEEGYLYFVARKDDMIRSNIRERR